MKNYKIEIQNESEFNEVIELAEKIGYRNPSFLYQRINNYLFLKDNGMLHTGTFEPETYKEITIEQLRILAGEKKLMKLTDLTEKQVVHCATEEPQPKEELKKVWAWDNNPEYAFKTYLIKEFQGFEYNYLCIYQEGVRDFENKYCIDTATYKNISESDPRNPNDVLKIVEKYGKDKLITLIEKL